jgi:hypothetical protein
MSCVTVLALALALPQSAAAQKNVPVSITAEELAKECAAGPEKAEKKYAGKVLRVTGKVGDVFDGVLYLPTKAKLDGTELAVVVRFDAKAKHAVKTGETATFEGTFDRVAVLGPQLKGSKLVPAGKKPK